MRGRRTSTTPLFEHLRQEPLTPVNSTCFVTSSNLTQRHCKNNSKDPNLTLLASSSPHRLDPCSHTHTSVLTLKTQLTPKMDPSPDIDGLLKHYLTLLDKYTALRTELSRLQSATFHNLARANFAAERGLRFGPDHYDERMQALTRASITDAGSGPMFHVVRTQSEQAETAAASRQEADAAETGDPKKQATSKDPIRWFGLLTPPALRQTQASAVEAVECVIPQLLTVDAEMRRVEIEVRRARKRRAKAEAAAVKREGVREAAGDEVAVP